MISEFALFLFTTLAGTAAGGYIARAIVPLDSSKGCPRLFAAVCLVMLTISGIALLGHLGQPARVLHAFSNPGAGITQEGITTVLFGITVVADLALCLKEGDSPRWLVVLAAVLGFAMTVTMGLAYYAFIGTPAWATATTIPFFVMGDLAMGVGLYIAFNHDTVSKDPMNGYGIAVQAVAGVCVLAMGMHFANAGYSIIPFIAGAAVGPVLACVFFVAARKEPKPWTPGALCVCAIVGIAIARYAFYMGCLI